MLEQRIFPFGLVRYGVAPDHQSVKNVTDKFTQIASHENFKFIGNVQVPKDISIDKLLKSYNAVIMATGSKYDKKLGIKGEDSPNVFSAKDFVGWYNGEPDCQVHPNLQSDTAVIIGQGNVAIDCTRLLLADDFDKTDISQSALQVLKNSKINKVHVVGRRGVLQVSFTTKEVRELQAKDIGYTPNPLIAQVQQENKEMLSKIENRPLSRLVQVMAKQKKGEFEKSLELHFWKSPIEIVSENNKIVGVRLAKNILVNGRVKQTEEQEYIPCGLVIKSIGYEGEQVDGVPFNPNFKTIPNSQGRVFDNNGNIVPGLYTAGWIKTGRGEIAATLYDAQETCRSIVQDIPLFEEKPDCAIDIAGATTFDDYLKLDREEIKRGEPAGKIREKITSKDEMLSLLKN
ncbi:hypothetical protein HDV01_000556 [Terramyces sp. JEL0728]|nr:hypothetical protein HDV01_000556 [Terramyces sp. JEL0728]